MNKVQQRHALRQAASATLARLTNDAQALSTSTTRQMVEYLRDHLFEQQLTIERIKKACGIRDNSIALRFHHFLGRAPHEYLVQARMEVARRLLVDTELAIWQISDLLGFSSIQVFSRAFARHEGVRPSRFRQGKARGTTGETSAEPLISVRRLQRILDGKGAREDVATIVDQLSEMYDL